MHKLIGDRFMLILGHLIPAAKWPFVLKRAWITSCTMSLSVTAVKRLVEASGCRIGLLLEVGHDGKIQIIAIPLYQTGAQRTYDHRSAVVLLCRYQADLR